MNAPRTRRVLTTIASLLAALLAAPGHALDIVLTDGSTVAMTATEFAAAEAAAQQWEGRFDDPIVVNIIISFAALPDNALGRTRIAKTTHPYTSVRAALLVDATPGNEFDAVAQLNAPNLPLVDVNGPRNATQMTLSTANAKALGLGIGLDALYPNPLIGVDATIVFASSRRATFDFDSSDGITPGFTDFEAVAAHEIGHALGFDSQADIQDDNPGLVLAPAGLDVWRWPETGAAHTLSIGYRLLTADPAEWYDSVLNNVTLSHGTDVFDPLCPSTAGSCQASHWSDDQANLMDPTLGTDTTISAREDDFHALDYIGYDANLVAVPFGQIDFADVHWFDAVDFVPMTMNFPQPPWPQNPPSSLVNVAWASFMKLGELGHRSAAGFARFKPQVQIEPNLVNPSPNPRDHSNLNPPGPGATFRPAALSRMTLQFDGENGVPFRFRDNCAQTGCQYDPTLGDFGGYRIPGWLDAAGDAGEDIDGRIVLILLADANQIPDPQSHNVFHLDADSPETYIQIFDRQAFGLGPLNDSDDDGVPDVQDNCLARANADQRDTDGDGFGNICDADFNNDWFVNAADLGFMRSVFLSSDADADLNGDGVVNIPDLGVMKSLFLAAPGPSGVGNMGAGF